MADQGFGTRRSFLGVVSTAIAAVGCASAAGGHDPHEEDEGATEVKVGPGEDLMREHGVLRRVLFVYDEAIHRLDTRAEFSPDVLVSGAGIVRRVIEDYHEQIEEKFVFPRFEKAGKQVDLVRVLREQHQAGRRLTDGIVELAERPLDTDTSRSQLSGALRSFNRMYRPHAAREDTILFPAFHELVGEHAYDELGEQFEDQEKDLLGEGGFENAIADVVKLEGMLGMQDLSSYTPR